MTKEIEPSAGVRLSSPITGFVDYTPEQQCLFDAFFKKTIISYEKFGFTPLSLRPFERLSSLKGEGETEKQIFELFRLDTKESTGLGLPFDHTVPLALYVAEHAGHLQHLSLPYKRYDMGLSFRGERPKTGRFRAFVQADVDIVGRKLNLSSDAECLLATLDALTSFNIGSFHVFFNHIGIIRSLLNEHKIPSSCQAAVLRAVDKLDKISADEVIAEILKIECLNMSRAQIQTLISAFTTKRSLNDPDLLSIYGQAAEVGLLELRTLLSLLKQAMLPHVEFSFAPHMVRGLAYYTGIVFETHLVGKEQYGSIASGGRYSNLVSDFADNLGDVEGVGISLGLTRLLDILIKTGFAIPPRQTTAQVLVSARTDTLMPKAYAVATTLRNQGFRVDIYSGPAKVKNALSHAASIGIDYTVLVMDDNAIVTKHMRTQTQKEWPDITSAVAFFKP